MSSVQAGSGWGGAPAERGSAGSRTAHSHFPTQPARCEWSRDDGGVAAAVRAIYLGAFGNHKNPSSSFLYPQPFVGLVKLNLDPDPEFWPN